MTDGVQAAPDPVALREALRDVVDPELPVVSVVDMGMVERIDVTDDGHVTVEILPTFSGCPALDVIARDVHERLLREPTVTDVAVRFVLDPPWSTDRITAAGQDALRGFGVAPAPPTRGRPLAMLSSQSVTCPYCGSRHTVLENLFGPTPCRSLYRCADCRNPFERFKAL